jgi:hypothetical protein
MWTRSLTQNFLPVKILLPEKFRVLKFSRAKISGQKNFTSEKNRTLKFLHPKKTGFENSERENFPARKFSVRKKVRHVLQKIALQQQEDPKRIFRKSSAWSFRSPPMLPPFTQFFSKTWGGSDLRPPPPTIIIVYPPRFHPILLLV